MGKRPIIAGASFDPLFEALGESGQVALRDKTSNGGTYSAARVYFVSPKNLVTQEASFAYAHLPAQLQRWHAEQIWGLDWESSSSKELVRGGNGSTLKSRLRSRVTRQVCVGVQNVCYAIMVLVRGVAEEHGLHH